MLNNINFNNIKEGFSDYLNGLNESSNNKYKNTDSDESIFNYSDEFEDYLSDEFDIDADFDDIDDIEIKDGKLVDPDDGSEESFIAKLFNGLLETDEMKDAVDTDADGEISDEEIKNYIDDVKENDDNKNNFSLTDILESLQRIQQKQIDAMNNQVTAQQNSTSSSAQQQMQDSSVANYSGTQYIPQSSGSSGGGGSSVGGSSGASGSSGVSGASGVSKTAAAPSPSFDEDKTVITKEGTNFNYNLTESQAADLEKFKANYEQNKEKYEEVAKATNAPAELIAAIHWRESGGNFDTYLHNGDPLGQPTTHVPAGIYFEDWTEAAVHAINSQGTDAIKAGDLQSCYDFAERYNGLGYKNKGLPSPYVWSGTDNYQCGKYVADGVFDANTKDKQLGVAVMMDSIMA